MTLPSRQNGELWLNLHDLCSLDQENNSSFFLCRHEITHQSVTHKKITQLIGQAFPSTNLAPWSFLN